MDIIQAVVLGIVQGLGEFLPISSSAHLILVPWFFGWDDQGLTFDVALHFGTLIAVVAFFWRDWVNLTVAGLQRRRSPEGRLFWYIVLATVPGALAGYLLEDHAATTFRNPFIIGTMLILMGVLLWAVDHYSRRVKRLNDIGLGTALFIGVAQAFAIIPGVSRSGATITAARMAGVTREAAARFSFLLSTPVIFGAAVFQLKDISAGDLTVAFITGIVTSAVVGFLAIGFLLRYVIRHNFNLFVWYRFALGLAVIVTALVRG
ncbi:undecaprenyl-diphosphatase UppP [Desulforudis sp. 1088]|uniref:undecaprenyl-diphosphatase UppP n=1 Tax=Desulforudis sp. Tu-874 TaxID=3416276 RepID=UPI003CE53B17